VASPDPASLANLHDIIVPEAVSWWPLASGSYAIASVMLIISAWFIARSAYRWRRNAYRRNALTQLQQLKATISPETAASVLGELATLMRRVALTVYPRSQIAGLTGDAWLNFLDESAATTQFANDNGRRLMSAAYGTHASIATSDAEKLVELVEHWVIQHRGPLG
jgi:hypothetical protein